MGAGMKPDRDQRHLARKFRRKLAVAAPASQDGDVARLQSAKGREPEVLVRMSAGRNADSARRLQSFAELRGSEKAFPVHPAFDAMGANLFFEGAEVAA